MAVVVSLTYALPKNSEKQNDELWVLYVKISKRNAGFVCDVASILPGTSEDEG